jgi:hypothetical protein
MPSLILHKNKQRIIVVLLIGISLTSYYLYEIGIHIISSVSFSVLAFLFFAGYFGKSQLMKYEGPDNIIIVFYLLLLFSGFASLIFYQAPPLSKKITAFFVLLIATIIASNSYKKIDLKSYLSAYLIFHSFFFYIQLFAFLTLGVSIDYLEQITGEAQRHSGGLTLPLVGFFERFSGLFNEPGTYAVYIAPFIALFSRYYHLSKKYRIIFYISLLSIIISLSVYGVVFAFFIIFFNVGIAKSKKILFSLCTMPLALIFLYERFIINAKAGHSVGISFRQNFIMESYSFLAQNLESFLFGAGLLRNDARAEFYGAFNDVGLFFYIFHFSGFIGALLTLYIVFFVFLKRDRSSSIAIIIVFTSKLSLLSLQFPFILSAILYLEKDKIVTLSKKLIINKN